MVRQLKFIAALLLLATSIALAQAPNYSSHSAAGAVSGVTAGQGLSGGGSGAVTLRLATGTIDASRGYVSGDPCATIATNLTAAVATNPQSVDLDMSNFANTFTNGVVPCNSNPFENQVFSGTLRLGPIQIVKSVPWVTPGNNQRFTIYGDGTSDPGIPIASTNSTITDCGPEAPGWNGTACVIGAVTVPAFPSTGHCITFTYPHGSYGAATYCPSLWLGGMGPAGVNFGGSFGAVIRDFNIQAGQGGGNFSVYSSGIQEQSLCYNVVARASNNAAFFFDKVQGTGSGPGHWSMNGCTGRMDANQTPPLTAAQGYPNVANQIGMGYGIWAEGNGISVYFTGGTCTTYPQGYPTNITANGPINTIKMTYAGTCSNVTGLACHIGTQHGGTGETCTATTVGNTVTGITAGGVGTNYNLGDTQTGAPFEIANATINGKNTANMRASIVLDGLFSPHISSIHTGFNADWGVIVGYGSGVIVGGLFENVDLENMSNGVYHIGVGSDNSQIFLATGRGGTVATIQDDTNNFTSGTSVPCSLYEPGTLNTCNTGGVTVLTNTTTSGVPLTITAITGQSGDLLDAGVTGTGNLFTVSSAGLGTFVGGLSSGANLVFSAATPSITTSTTNASLILAPNGTGAVVTPVGTVSACGLCVSGSLTTGISAPVANQLSLLANGAEAVHVSGGAEISSNGSFKWSQTALAGGTVGISLVAIGTGGTEAIATGGNSTPALLLLGTGNTPTAGNGCKVPSAGVAMSVSGTAVPFCTWTLPNAAATWAYQCHGTYTTSTATDTFGLGINIVIAPASSSRGEASISSTASGTLTSGGAAYTASGATSIFTGATVSNVTDIPFEFHGVVFGSATTGAFSLTGTLTGTSPAGTINAGTTCILY